MPDWERYRATFLKGDLKAQNLERLRTMERWLGLRFEQCAAAAQAAFQGAERRRTSAVVSAFAGAVLEAHERSRVRGARSGATVTSAVRSLPERDGHAGGVPSGGGAVQHRPDQRGTDGTLPGHRAAFARNAGGERAGGKDRADQRAFDECAYHAGTGECGGGRGSEGDSAASSSNSARKPRRITRRARMRSISAAQRPRRWGTRRPTWATARQRWSGTPRAASFSTKRTTASTPANRGKKRRHWNCASRGISTGRHKEFWDRSSIRTIRPSRCRWPWLTPICRR